MKKSEINKEFNDKGFVILRNFMPVKKYKDAYKSICYHLEIDSKNEEIDFQNLKIHKKLIDLRKSKIFQIFIKVCKK